MRIHVRLKKWQMKTQVPFFFQRNLSEWRSPRTDFWIYIYRWGFSFVVDLWESNSVRKINNFFFLSLIANEWQDLSRLFDHEGTQCVFSELQSPSHFLWLALTLFHSNNDNSTSVWAPAERFFAARFFAWESSGSLSLLYIYTLVC